MDKDEVFDFFVDIEEAINNKNPSETENLLEKFERTIGTSGYVYDINYAARNEDWENARECASKLIDACINNYMDKFFYRFVKYDRWLERMENELIQNARDALSETSSEKYNKAVKKICDTREKYSKSGNKFAKKNYKIALKEPDMNFALAYTWNALRRMGLTYYEKMTKCIKKLEK